MKIWLTRSEDSKNFIQEETQFDQRYESISHRLELTHHTEKHWSNKDGNYRFESKPNLNPSKRTNSLKKKEHDIQYKKKKRNNRKNVKRNERSNFLVRSFQRKQQLDPEIMGHPLDGTGHGRLKAICYVARTRLHSTWTRREWLSAGSHILTFRHVYQPNRRISV